jgi:hypothetical protein
MTDRVSPPELLRVVRPTVTLIWLGVKRPAFSGQLAL